MLEHISVGIKYYKIPTAAKFTPKIMLEFECGLERNGKMAWLKQGCQCSCSFSFASLFFLKDSSLDQNHDGTLLLAFISAQKKTFLSRCRTWTSVSRLLHDNKGRKKLEQLVCSLGLYDKKQLYMRWSQFWHFRSNVPRYEVDLWCLGWFVQNMRTVLLPAPQFYTLVQFLFHRLNFVGFCTKFPLVAFLYKTFFCEHKTAHFCKCCAQKAQCFTLNVWINLNKSERSTPCAPVKCANLNMCICANVHMLKEYCSWHWDLLFAALPWWTFC